MPDFATGPGRYAADIDPYPGDVLAAGEPPPYPSDWTPDQRLTAYWYAHGHHINVRPTEAWRAILTDAQRNAQRHQSKLADIRGGRA